MREFLEQEPWRGQAACRNLPREAFFDETSLIEAKTTMTTRERRWRAKQVCVSCPVARECTAYATRTKSHYGIFGGLDQRDRWVLRNQPREAGALVVIARRLRIDGLEWPAIAERLGTDPAWLRKMCEGPLGQRPHRGLKEYAAWPLVDQGASPEEIAIAHHMPLAEAEAMCRAMDRNPEYHGVKGEERGLHHAEAGLIAC